MVTVLAAAAAHRILSPTQAWKVHVAIKAHRQKTSRQGKRFSVLPADDGYRPVFMGSVATFHANGRLPASRRGPTFWPVRDWTTP